MKKKLLVDAHTFDENHQGIRSFIKGIYSAIDVKPDDLEIFLIANDIDNLKQEFKHQKYFKFIKLKHTNKYIRLAYEIPKLINRLNVDFAHFNYFLPLFLSKKCKYIVTIHDVLFIDYPQYFPKKYRIINTLLYKRSVEKAHILTTVSEYSRQTIKKNFNVSQKPITILPNAVNPIYSKYHDKQSDRLYMKNKFGLDKYIIFVSRFEPRKNHIGLLRAYKELKLWEDGYSLVFVGKETFENPALSAEIESVNIASKNMIFKIEDVNNDDLVRFYNAANLAVFPSLCEGFGIPPLESAILKTPTLCSNATAMSDFDFFGDFLFNPFSDEELKIKMYDVLQEKVTEDLDKISQTISERYSWKKTAFKLTQLLSKTKK